MYNTTGSLGGVTTRRCSRMIDYSRSRYAKVGSLCRGLLEVSNRVFCECRLEMNQNLVLFVRSHATDGAVLVLLVRG